jgi:3-methyl-2-oxobutanoate hydroxymethyltransferase
MKKHTTRTLKSAKGQNLQMLTCYDFQTAELMNELPLDLILVGDSLGNVVLGYETTVSVSVEEMIVFGSAVKRGAPDKFVVVDVPFGVTGDFKTALKACSKIFQTTKAEAVKIEGAHPTELKIIKRLTEMGIPVMGHIGLVPQSVHQLGGYYIHGKNATSSDHLKKEAEALTEAGCFSIVLECVEEKTAIDITKNISIPTIGIGSGTKTDGQVLVINDLLKMGVKDPPSFCKPVANFYDLKKKYLSEYLKK